MTVASAQPDRSVTGTRPGPARLFFARGGAVALGILTIASLGAASVLHVANQDSPTADGVIDWWLFPFVSGVSFVGTGAWLVLVRPRLSVGWLALVIGTTNAVMMACLEYGVWALDQPGGAPLGSVALWLGNWMWVAGLLLIATVLPLLLPEGRLVTKRWRVAFASSMTVVIANSVSWAVTPYETWSPALAAAEAVNPLGVDWIWHAVVQVPLIVATVVAVLVAFGSLVVRFRRSGGIARQQLKWILLGGLLTLMLWAAGLLFGPVFTGLAMLPLPLGCLVAVLRWRLWDIDLVVSRSLRYTALTIVVIGLYAASVGILGGLLGRTTGAPLVATAIVAVCVEPLHRRLRALTNRLVFGEPDDPFAVLARAGQRLASARDATSIAEEVLPEVVVSVASALRLPYVAVALADGATVEYGTRVPSLAHIALTYGGLKVGQLDYTPRPGGVGTADQRLLGDLARHAAVATHTVTLARELARSREQLVAAREDERRRLFRELHDGLGPTLAALALQVETARDLTPTDPVAAHALLDRTIPRLKSTVDEVRNIVRGLRPPTLDDLGLATALRELGAAFAGPGFAVSVHTSDLPTLSAAVEVAAYRIAGEALANAARHARAAAAVLHVSQRDGQLHLIVQDDGQGCPPHALANGFGVASMHERAHELGGTFTLGSGQFGRGTRVEATLPLGWP